MSLTSTNFLALLTIFLLAFTKTLPRAASSILLVHSIATVLLYVSLIYAIVLAAYSFAFIAIPFRILYHGIRHGQLPPDWIWVWEGFKKLADTLKDVFHPYKHSHKIEEAVSLCWEELKVFFASTFSGPWKKLVKFIWKHTPTAPAHTPTLDDTSHQSIRMGPVDSDNPETVGAQ